MMLQVRRGNRRMFLLALVPVMLVSLCWIGVEEASADQTIFNNENGGGVMNSPTKQTTFSMSKPFKITLMRTYHWNNGKGTPSPGTIGLKGADGKTYGPWSTTGAPGSGGVPNAFWIAKPNAVVPAGNYTVVDSNPATWSQNSATGGAGFALVNGDPESDDTKGRVNLPRPGQAPSDEKGQVKPLR